MLAVLRFVSISEGKMQKKVKKQTMKISCMCTFKPSPSLFYSPVQVFPDEYTVLYLTLLLSLRSCFSFRYLFSFFILFLRIPALFLFFHVVSPSGP